MIEKSKKQDISTQDVRANRHKLFEKVLQSILPYLGSDEGKIILTQVLTSLKLEGIIGKEVSQKDVKMVKIIKDAIMAETEKRKDALNVAQKLLHP